MTKIVSAQVLQQVTLGLDRNATKLLYINPNYDMIGLKLSNAGPDCRLAARGNLGLEQDRAGSNLT